MQAYAIQRMRRLPLLCLPALAWAQGPAPLPPPAPLPTPAVIGPLQAAPPIEIAAGPLGRLQFNGTISVLGLWQGQSVAGNRAARADLGNGMVFLQKTSGPVQFYLQAGAYNVPILGVKYLSTGDTVHDFFGPVPVAYLKVPLGGNANIEAGVLPTLIGAEDTFTFQNLNVARGLLWNQENDVNRGVQINDAVGKWSGSLSWNDGYYSNRYTWIIAEMSYALSAAHAIEVVGGGNLGRTAARTLATPVQNNSRIVDVIYSYTHGPWIVQPYLQVTGVPTDPSAGVARGAATRGAAVLASYTFKDRFSLAGRAEYLRSTGSAAQGSVNLLYGAGSRAWSFTVTPGWQRQRFFARADLGVVGAARTTPGEAFGPAGASRHQARSLLEAGLLF